MYYACLVIHACGWRRHVTRDVVGDYRGVGQVRGSGRGRAAREGEPLAEADAARPPQADTRLHPRPP